MDIVGHDFHQRLEYEAPQVHAGMGQRELGSVYNKVVIENNIYIHRPRVVGPLGLFF